MKFARSAVGFIAPSHLRPMVTMMPLVLVTSDDCHLCEHGRGVLAALAVEARNVDVASPEALELSARGVPLAFLPVLCDGDRVVAYGRFSERRLRRELGV